MSDDSRVLNTLRYMAFDRAKGELNSMLQTFWSEDEGYKKMKAIIDKFINELKDNCL